MRHLILATLFALALALGASIASAQIHRGPIASQPPPQPGETLVFLNPIGPVPPRPVQPGPGIPIYRASECIGSVVNGVCNGTVIDTEPMRPRCHGTLLPDGTCTGPVF